MFSCKSKFVLVTCTEVIVFQRKTAIIRVCEMVYKASVTFLRYLGQCF